MTLMEFESIFTKLVQPLGKIIFHKLFASVRKPGIISAKTTNGHLRSVGILWKSCESRTGEGIQEAIENEAGTIEPMDGRVSHHEGITLFAEEPLLISNSLWCSLEEPTHLLPSRRSSIFRDL